MATINESLLLRSPNQRLSPAVKTVIAFSSFLAIFAVVTLTSFTTLHITGNNPFHRTLASDICSSSPNPTSCRAILTREATANSGFFPVSHLQLLQSLIKTSVSRLDRAISKTNSVRFGLSDPTLENCAELMDLSRDRLTSSGTALSSDGHISYERKADVHTWLSAVMTNYVTCADNLHISVRTSMEAELDDLISMASASLALISSISQSTKSDLLEPLKDDFPTWLSAKDRKLLQHDANAITANVVVAQDGSGKYKKVQEAVNAAPNNSNTRYVIYIKKGTYKENVSIGKAKKNLMIVGDGMDSTIITGSLNVVDGSTTFNSATVASVGDGFIAQDLCFQNTAGAIKHQAVALRVGADQSVINRCKIEAYQDTLYTHSLRQFYRDCTITGTVDFIFGDAAVVIQNSNIIARKPMSNQQNLVTAQGRTDPNSNTGTSIQKCQILPSSDLKPVKGSIKSYLGRPWKEYSRTVYLQSNIDDHIDPAGWLPWSGDFALSTLYYGEYANTGAGSGTSKRVKWAGYRVITSASEASKFTVSQFLQGGSWIQAAGVTFTAGL